MFIHTGNSGAESKARFWQYINGVMSTDIHGIVCVCCAVAGGFGMVLTAQSWVFPHSH